jgi:SAM-dependent methyltransferase
MNTIDVSFCKTNTAQALRTLLQYQPLSLCIREIMRMRALADLSPLPTPMLDIGCGDGLFWEVAAKSIKHRKKDMLEGLIGIDISDAELSLASVRLQKTGVMIRNCDITQNITSVDITELKGRFRTVFANCSLEHVYRLQSALENITHYLAPGGQLVIVAPVPSWTSTLAIKQRLDRLSPRLGGMFGGMLDGFFQHKHLLPHYAWEHLLKGFGFRSVDITGLGSASANRIFDKWLLSSFPAFVWKCFFKKYPIWFTLLKYAHIKRHYGEFLGEVERGEVIVEDLDSPAIVEYLIICKL